MNDMAIQRKCDKIENELRCSIKAAEILTELAVHIKPEDRQFFAVSLLNPQIRRRKKCETSLQFWRDPFAVQEWLNEKAMANAGVSYSLDD